MNFGALMRLPCRAGDTVEWVLSRSPELFLRHEDFLADPVTATRAILDMAGSSAAMALVPNQ